ncbi:hypothetical protein F2Q69_00058903 [Brassica cretica]|uniref:Uncharacterized protein n=1 Tax=Brassica cretica TaxID=69181 RepID=A0A8S9RG41_BRACR|nr:hypothetical protein F2Q69_00058903 [Brassica cretica]
MKKRSPIPFAKASDRCKGRGGTCDRLEKSWIKQNELYAQGRSSLDGLQRPPILANPHKSGTTTVALPQRIKMGMRHKAGMGSNLNPATPDMEISSPAFERQNAKSKQVPVVVLPRKVEYGPCEKQNIPGSQGTPGLYASPRSKEETQGSPNDFGSQGLRKNLRVPIRPQGSEDKKEVRTSVQPRAHRGHHNFNKPSGSKQRSLDQNLRVPTWPQRHNTLLTRRIEPLCSLGRIGVITSLKDLRVPTRPQGPGAPGSRYDLRI